MVAQAEEANGELMVVPVPLLALLLAQSTDADQASAAPEPRPPAHVQPQEVTAGKAAGCGTPESDSRVIVVCTQRPQGYRLNPDLMEAKRELRRGNAGRPPRPGGTVTPDCATVGPAPCIYAGVNLLAAAATAAEMAKRLASGEEIGSMFVTDPHPTEYQLYLAAKARREAEEREKATKKAKAAQAQRPNSPAANVQMQDQQLPRN
jgi:hypothetical protein